MKAVWIAILAVSVPALSQEPGERPRVGITGAERKLTLEQAIQEALGSNLQIEIERTNVDTAAQIMKAAQGVFDPVFRYRPSLETRNTPTPNVLISPTGTLTERIHREDFSLQQLNPCPLLSGHSRKSVARMQHLLTRP